MDLMKFLKPFPINVPNKVTFLETLFNETKTQIKVLGIAAHCSMGEFDGKPYVYLSTRGSKGILIESTETNLLLNRANISNKATITLEGAKDCQTCVTVFPNTLMTLEILDSEYLRVPHGNTITLTRFVTETLEIL